MMKSTVWKWITLVALLTFYSESVQNADGSSRRRAYEVEFATSQYNVTEDQGTLILYLKANTTTKNVKPEEKNRSCQIKRDKYTVSQDFMKNNYNISLKRLSTISSMKLRKCNNFSVEINITDDNMHEKYETFNVTLTTRDESRILIGLNSTAVITSEDDDGISLGFNSTNATITEGNGILLILVANATAAIDYSVYISINNTETGPEDHNYGSTNTKPIKVTFPAGSNKSSVNITAYDDDSFENNEIFTAALTSTSDPTNILIGMRNQTTVTIENINIFYVYFKDDVYNVSEGCARWTIPIFFQLPGNGSQVNITVTVRSKDASATCGMDYYYTANITLSPTKNSRTTANLSLFVVPDNILETNESFTMELVVPSNVAANKTKVYIQNDDTLSINFSSPMETVRESNGSFILTLVANGIAAFEYFVNINVSIESSQTEHRDHNASGLIKVQFPAGQVNTTVLIAIYDDQVFENNETFTAEIMSTSDASVRKGGINKTTITILDDDIIMMVYFQNASYSYPENNGTVLIPVFVKLPKNGSEVNVTLNVYINGTDGVDLDSSDFNSSSYDIIILPPTTNSEAMLNLTITINSDDILERDENFHITLGTTDDRITIKNSIVFTILNDDGLLVELFSPMKIVNESSGSLMLTLVANGTAMFEYSVNISIDNSLTDMCNHNATETINIKFPAGHRNVTEIITIDDKVFENDAETFTAEIMSTSDSSVMIGGINRTTISINDDDIIKMYFQNASYSYLENSGMVQIPVLFILPNNGSEVNITLDVISNDGNAPGLTDFSFSSSVTLHPTCMSKALLNLSITIENDTTLEKNEDFNFTLQARDQNRIQIVNESVAFTILNDDGLSVGFATTMKVVNESEGSFMLILEANATASFNYTVNITIQNNSTIKVEFQAGNKTAGVVIDIDDEVYEINETFAAKISPIFDDNIEIGMNETMIVTILDNDNITIYFQDTPNEIPENGGLIKVPVHAYLPNNGSQVEVILSATFSNQTAISTHDYFCDVINYTLGSTANDTATVQLHVNIKDDDMVERDETFRIEIDTALPRVYVVNSTNVTILNDDVLEVEFPSSMGTVNESNGTYILVVKSNITASFDITVNITIENISTSFADHNATANIPVRILARTTMANVTIPIDDEVYESNETFKAVITSTSESDDRVKIGMINTTKITIEDDDNIDIYFQKSVYEFGEERETNVVYIHARLPMFGSQAEVILQICVTEENATNIVDYHYNQTSYPLAITSRNYGIIPLYIHIVNDTIVELNETFHIKVETTHPRVNILNSSSVSILDDDEMFVNFRNDIVVIAEQDDKVVIPLQASNISGFDFNITVCLISITTNGSDYDAHGNLVVKFFRSNSEASVTIHGIDDHIYEHTEMFQLNITQSSHPSKIFIGSNNTARVNITDDEVVQVSFDKHTYTARESDEQITIHLKASLPKGGSEIPFFVAVASMDGDAKSVYDYRCCTPNTTNFSKHSKSEQITVNLVDDNISEAVENFMLHVTDQSTRINITTRIVMVQIEDDDPCPCGIGGTCVYNSDAFNFSCDCLQDYLGTLCQIYVGEARIGISIGVGVAASIAGAIILIVTAILIVVSCWPKHTLQLKEDDQKRKAKSSNYTDTTSFGKSISRNAKA